MKYKLIASDVDGTLVPEGSSDLNPQLYEYILKLKEHGVRFAAASGRQYESVKYAFEPIRDDILFIADNGAFIYEKDRMLFSDTFQLQEYRDLVRYLKTVPGLNIMVSSLEGSYTDSKDKAFIDQMSDGYGLDLIYSEDLSAHDLHVSKIGVYCTIGEPDEQAADGRKKVGSFANILISGTHWVDYLPRSVCKGAGLSWIQEYLNIPESQTIAFGDQGNDVSMFEHAGLSFAVPGGAQAAREAAMHVMEKGPEQDGVLHVLQDIFGF